MLFISFNVDNQFTNQPTKCTKFFLKCLHYTTQNVPTCFNPQWDDDDDDDDDDDETQLKQYCIKHS
jgi:hypothetical protein